MNPASHRFHVLDALRGICALLVVLFHAKFNAPLLQLEFVRSAWQFVDFFFVLSGFVIAANYRTRLEGVMPVSDFMGLRFGRIYPLHLFMLLAYLMMECVGIVAGASVKMAHAPFTGAYTPESFVSNLFLLQSFGLHDRLTWNQPAWSIATEFWCYLLFALGVVAAGPRLERWLVGVVILCPLLLLQFTAYGINVTYDWGMVRCIYGFALGVLCWWVWQGRFGRLSLARGIWTVTEIALLLLIGGFVSYAGTQPINVLGPPLFAVAVLVFAHAGGAVSSALGTRLPLWLGTLSYSIYMVHQFVQSRFNDIAETIGMLTGQTVSTVIRIGGGDYEVFGTTQFAGNLGLAIMIALVLLTSVVTYRLVELPGQRWSRKWISQRKAARG